MRLIRSNPVANEFWNCFGSRGRPSGTRGTVRKASRRMSVDIVCTSDKVIRSSPKVKAASSRGRSNDRGGMNKRRFSRFDENIRLVGHVDEGLIRRYMRFIFGGRV